ncbi:cytochrome p450 [Moniliophthora roreri]|nr:cytochrome p450 [Moniliophthora roreri]
MLRGATFGQDDGVSIDLGTIPAKRTGDVSHMSTESNKPSSQPNVSPEGLASPYIAVGKSYDQLTEISRVRHVVKFYMYDTIVTDTVSPDLSSIFPSPPTDITKSLNRLSWFWMSLGEAEVLVDPSSVKEAMDFRHQDVATEIPWYEDLHDEGNESKHLLLPGKDFTSRFWDGVVESRKERIEEYNQHPLPWTGSKVLYSTFDMDLPLNPNLLVYIPLLGAVSLALFLTFRSKRRSLSFLRGPPNTSVFLGNEYDMLQQFEIMTGPLFQWTREYGSAFRAKTILNEDMLIVSDPKALQHIFHKSSYRYPKSADSEFGAHRLFGPGVASVQGTVHQRQRKIMSPAFSSAQIKPFVEIFQRTTATLVSQWREQLAAGKDVIDTTKHFQNLTLDALGATVFDYDFGALRSSNNELAYMVRNLFVDSVRPTKLRYLWNNMRSRFMPRTLSKLGTALMPTKEDIRWQKWLKASKDQAKILYDNKLQGETSEENDVLGVLSRSLDAKEPEKKLDAEEALSQMSYVYTFRLYAENNAQVRTLTALSLWLAMKHLERLIKEIHQVREQKGSDSDLSASDYDSMPFLNAVIKETLRLHPIATRLIREASEDDVISLEYPIPSTSGDMLSEIPVVKGQRIMTSIIGYNYLTQVWGEDADEWNPERHLDAKRATTLGVYGNLVHEIQTVTALLVESFEFSMLPGVDIMMVDAALLAPVVRGKKHEGIQMPLKVKLRESD